MGSRDNRDSKDSRDSRSAMNSRDSRDNRSAANNRDNRDSKETEKHQLIMTAAASLFAKQGYHKTTIDEIVARAGISKGLFYHYFENKRDIYIHLYNSYVDILSKTIREKIDTGNSDFFVRLTQVTRIRIDFIAAYPSLFNFLYSAYYEEHPDVAPLIHDKNKQIMEESATSSMAHIDWSKFKDGMTPEKAIELITWVAEGFVKKIGTPAEADNKDMYLQFDEYIEYLKSGMYREGER